MKGSTECLFLSDERVFVNVPKTNLIVSSVRFLMVLLVESLLKVSIRSSIYRALYAEAGVEN